MKKYIGDFAGGSRQGEIRTTLNKLIEVFGEPHKKGLCDKVPYEWQFELTDGSVVTLYPYKYSPRKNNLFTFSVGGNSEKSAKELIKYFNSILGE